MATSWSASATRSASLPRCFCRVLTPVKKRPASLKYLIISLVSLIVIAIVIGIFAARSYTGTPFRVQGVQHLTMDHIFNGTFGVRRSDILWVPEGEFPFHST